MSFLHAAPTASKRRHGEKAWSVSDLLDEATRKPGHCSHVDNPGPPTWHHGSREDVEGAAVAWHAQARRADKKSKTGMSPIQKNSPCLVCIVASLPAHLLNIWPEYRDSAIAHYRRQLGARVFGVAEHLDEAHPHIHIYCVPYKMEPFGAVHPGYGASRAARKTPGNLIRTAYRQAMADAQDDFHVNVASKFGLERFGPKRRRMNREAWSLLKVTLKKGKEANAAAEEKTRRAAEAVKITAEDADVKMRAANAKGRKAQELHGIVSASIERYKETPKGELVTEVERLKVQLAEAQSVIADQAADLDAKNFRVRAYEADADRRSRRETDSVSVMLPPRRPGL